MTDFRSLNCTYHHAQRLTVVGYVHISALSSDPKTSGAFTDVTVIPIAASGTSVFDIGTA